MTYDVALLPGDGIGPEVVGEAVPVLERIERASGGDVALPLRGVRRRRGRLAPDGRGDLGRCVHGLRLRGRDAPRRRWATGRPQAFALAASRSGAPADGISRVTCVDKANVLDEAVALALADGSALTRDLGGSAGSASAGDAVLRALDAVIAQA